MLLVAGALGALAGWLAVRSTDESRIHAVIDRLADDAERDDVVAMAPLVSPSYRDGRGLGHDGVLQALAQYLKARTWSRVLPVKVIVRRIAAGRAEASAKIILAAAEGATTKHRVTDAMRIDLVLSREGGHWKVLSAEDWEIPAADVMLMSH